MSEGKLPLRVVAGLIRDETGRLLVCRRPAGKHLAGKWEFPGGKLERGETPAAGLVRELEEELGIIVAPEPPLTPVVHDYGRGPIQLIPIPCIIRDGTPEAREHDRIEWRDPADLGGLDLAAADLPILAEWQLLHAPRTGMA